MEFFLVRSRKWLCCGEKIQNTTHMACITKFYFATILDTGIKTLLTDQFANKKTIIWPWGTNNWQSLDRYRPDRQHTFESLVSQRLARLFIWLVLTSMLTFFNRVDSVYWLSSSWRTLSKVSCAVALTPVADQYNSEVWQSTSFNWMVSCPVKHPYSVKMIPCAPTLQPASTADCSFRTPERARRCSSNTRSRFRRSTTL